ncbi:MAG: DUF4340 domain-containing protein [Pirellulales bacterium]
MTESVKTSLFIGVALVALLAGWASRPKQVTVNVESRINQDLSQNFTDSGAAKRLKIVEFNETSATLREFEVAEVDGLWTIPSKDGYPADAERQMAEAATSLMDRKILSIAGESAADHEQFGVIDPLSPKLEAGQKGVGTHVTISDIEDKPLVDVIIGKKVKDSTNEQHYVREANRDVVYTVEVDPKKLSTNFEDWIEKDLLKLNAWDIQQVQINDYSAELQPVMTPQGIAIQVAWDPRAEMKLTYDEKDGKWNAEDLKQYDKGAQQYTEFKLNDKQELNTEALDSLKTALDDLAIVDVDRKPAGLSADLKAGVDFLDNADARKDLRALGFATVPNRDGSEGQELISSEGEVIVTMKDGVEYVLRFGDMRLDTSGMSSEATDAEHPAGATADEKAKAGDKNVQRYLFAMARFNENAIKKPELQPLPPLPEENAAAAPATTEPEKTPGTTEASAAAPTDAAKPEATEEEEEEEETNEAPAATESTPPAASSVEPRAGEQASTESKPTETKATEAPTSETPTPESKPEPQHSPEYEKVLAERKRIELENKRKLDEYNALVAKGRQQVQDLNLRFGDWYFVVSNDTFKKVRLGEKDVVKEKGQDAAGAKSSAAGAPGSAVPGLPSLPGLGK